MPDRFLTENARKAAQIRADQHLAAADVRRTQAKIAELTTHEVSLMIMRGGVMLI